MSKAKTYTKIKPISICPELMALKPFILPVKGFSYDEVLSMIQGVINRRDEKIAELTTRMNNISDDATKELKECYQQITDLKAEIETLKGNPCPQWKKL